MLLYRTAILIALFMFLTLPAYAETYEEKVADLDGDGVLETITVEFPEYGGDFVLVVDDNEYETYLNPYFEGFRIVDIDPSDDLMEIEVVSAGESDDFESLFFTYVNGHIIESGHTNGIVSIPGDGTVLAIVWMGFWMRTDLYILKDSNHRLENINQDLIAVVHYADSDETGVKCTVLESFTVFVDNDGRETLEIPDPGDSFFIVAYDNSPVPQGQGSYSGEERNEWYLIRTESGLSGWVSLSDFWDKVEGLQWAG